MSFGGFGSTPSTSSFGTSTFGQPTHQSSLFGGSAPTSTFGSQSAAPASTSGWPSFGSSNTTATTGFGTSSSTGISSTTGKTGTQHTPYTTTTEATGKGRLIAITAMPTYKDKSFEELRYEDYTMLKGQTPVPTTQSSAGSIGFGASTPFGSTSSTGFGASTSAAPTTGFGANAAATPTTSNWGSTFAAPSTTMAGFGSGFGSSTSSTFGQTTPSPFSASSSAATPAFGLGTSSQPPTTTFGSSAPTISGFGTTVPPTTGFGSTQASGFGATTPTTTLGFGSNTAASTGFGSTGFSALPAAGTGFGTSTFGQPTTSTAFGSGATFGATTPSTPAFGQSSTSSTGLFGSTPSQPTTGGLFGSTTTTAPVSAPSGSLFGSQPTTSTTTSGLFGQPTVGTTSGGLFGQPATTTGQPFGSSTSSTTGTGLFGSTSTAPASTGGLFGQPLQQQQQQQQQQQPSTGLFGQQSKPAGSAPFTFGSTTATVSPATSTGFGSTSGGLFGSQPTSSATQPTTTPSLFGAQVSSTTTPSSGFAFGSTPTQTQPASLFGGSSTNSAPSSSFSFGGMTSTTTATQPSLFGSAQQPSLFGTSTNSAKPPTSSLFGAPSPNTPSTFQFGTTSTTNAPAVQPSTGSLFGFASTAPASSTQLALTTTPQAQLQPYSTPLKPPPSIDSNPFGLKELPVRHPDSTNLTFQTPSTTPKQAIQRSGFGSAKPTPQSVARLRTRVRHAGPITPTVSLSPFDDKIFSISTLTSASKSVIPKVFRPQMPPKVELSDNPVTNIQSPTLNGGDRSAVSPPRNAYLDDNRRSMNSILESPSIPISTPTSSSRSLIANLRSLTERGYTFAPSLEALESMSESQLRCVTFQITKDGCGFARWSDFDLMSWSNQDVNDLVSITDKTVKLKGPAKRGNVICGVKAKTEMQASKSYEEKVRQFMAAKGFELLGLEDGYYSFKCKFGENSSNPTTPSVPPFRIH